MRQTSLEKQWDELMLLCGREKEYEATDTHLVLLKVVSRRIDELAKEMGFTDAQIDTREFRARKIEGRIVGIEHHRM